MELVDNGKGIMVSELTQFDHLDLLNELRWCCSCGLRNLLPSQVNKNGSGLIICPGCEDSNGLTLQDGDFLRQLQDVEIGTLITKVKIYFSGGGVNDEHWLTVDRLPPYRLILASYDKRYDVYKRGQADDEGIIEYQYVGWIRSLTKQPATHF